MKTLVFALIPLFPADCYAWREFTAMGAATDALIIADRAQTMETADNQWPESNPILGRYPSQERVRWTIGAGLVVNTLAHRFLPGYLLKPYQYIFISAELVAIRRSYMAGIRVNF